MKKQRIKTILQIVLGTLSLTGMFILACIETGTYVIGEEDKHVYKQR